MTKHDERWNIRECMEVNGNKTPDRIGAQGKEQTGARVAGFYRLVSPRAAPGRFQYVRHGPEPSRSSGRGNAFEMAEKSGGLAASCNFQVLVRLGTGLEIR
jgi:hypothetical protein